MIPASMDVIELGRGVRTGRAAAPTTRSRVRIPGRPCSTRPVSTGTRAFANNFKADNLKCFFYFLSNGPSARFRFLRYSANPVIAVENTLIYPDFMQVHFPFCLKKFA